MKVLKTFALCFIGIQSFACDCVFQTLPFTVKNSDIIITGKFIHGEKLWELSSASKTAPILYYTGLLVVLKTMKGANIKKGDTLSLSSDFDLCSTLFKVGTKYYLQARLTNGKITTTICSHTGDLGDRETKKNLKMTKKLL